MDGEIDPGRRLPVPVTVLGPLHLLAQRVHRLANTGHGHEALAAADGEVAGALVVERNVLEWRLDPRSDARLPFADSYDLEVIVTCQEGYTSSLAAAALQDLGLHRATDLDGGFAAWRDAGLPTIPGAS